jgi:tetratricopeptide (TPR) repeat protein
MRKHFTFLLAALVVALTLNAQITMPPAGGNKKASVSERIGITDVRIDYDRPAVNGREGKIWGEVVHYGFADLDYGTSKAAPWRAGANENTTFSFSTDVSVEGKLLPAGKYGFFVAMGPEKATLVFSKFNTAWGSFYYDSKDDALRVDVPVVKVNESVERLKYEFNDQKENSAVISLQWEKVKIPFTVSVDLQKEQIASFRREFNMGTFYRYWQNMNTAANYCLVNNINLEEGLSWADRSINTFFGESNFLTLSTYAGLLEKLNRKPEADSIMKKAYPMATMLQLYIYGRTLQRQNKSKEALAVYKMSYEKYGDDIYTLIGMIKGNAAVGNTKEALKFADKALAISKDSNTKSYVEKMAADVKAGKDIANM